MRLKLGRPNLADYAGYFDAPAARDGAPLTVTWAGVTTLLIDDGESAVMTDGFFSRPSLAEVGLRPLSPSPPRIDGSPGAHRRAAPGGGDAGAHPFRPRDGLRGRRRAHRRESCRRHVGADRSAAGTGLPDDRLVVVTPGEPITLGAYDVTLIESEHCPPDRFPGVITEPVVATGAGLGL